MWQKGFFPKKFSLPFLCVCIIFTLLLIQPIFLPGSSPLKAATLQIDYEPGYDQVTLDNHNIIVTGEGWGGESLDPGDMTLYSYDISGLIDSSPIINYDTLTINADLLEGYITIPDDLFYIDTTELAIGIIHLQEGEIISHQRLNVDFSPFSYDPGMSNLLMNGSTLMNYFDFFVASWFSLELQLEWSPKEPIDWQEVPPSTIIGKMLNRIRFDAADALSKGIFSPFGIYDFRIGITNRAAKIVYTLPMRDITLEMELPTRILWNENQPGSSNIFRLQIYVYDPDRDIIPIPEDPSAIATRMKTSGPSVTQYQAYISHQAQDNQYHAYPVPITSQGLIQFTPNIVPIPEPWQLNVVVSDGEFWDQVYFPIDIIDGDINHNPFMLKLDNACILLGETLTYMVRAIDPDSIDGLDTTITYSATLMGNPNQSNLFSDPNFNILTFQPQYSGEYQIEVVIRDGRGGEVRDDFFVSVKDPNSGEYDPRPIILTVLDSPVRIPLHHEYGLKIETCHPEEDLVSFQCTCNVPTPLNLTIDHYGLLRFYTDYPGQYPIEVIVTDSHGRISQKGFILEAINTTPLITSSPTTTATEDVQYQYIVTANDMESDKISYFLDIYPEGMQIDPNTGILSWTPDNDDIGEHTIRIGASDPDGATGFQEFALVVINVNDPPVLLPIGNKGVKEGETLKFKVTAIDPDSDPLLYSVTNLPEGASFMDRIFVWTPGFTQAGEYQNIIFEVSDGNIITSEAITIRVTNVNRVPEFESLEDQIVQEGSILTFTIHATDPDGDTMIYFATDLPEGARFDNQTFTWTPDIPHHRAYYHPVFWVCDGKSTISRKITIRVIGRELPPMLWFPGGVNLSGYAGSMVKQYGTAYGLLKTVGEQYLASISRYQPRPNTWQTVCWFNNKPSGQDFLLSDQEIYLINVRQPFDLNLPEIPEDPNRIALDLREGINLISFPDIPEHFSSFDLLLSMEEDAIQSIQWFSPMSQSWVKAFWDVNVPSGQDFPIQKGRGYLLVMNNDLTWDLSLLPTVNLQITPETIDWGDTAVINWETSRADLIYIEPNIGIVGATGSQVISPQQSTTFSITAQGQGGVNTASSTIIVNPPAPIIMFEADPNTLFLDGNTTSTSLTWEVGYADRVYIEPNIGLVQPQGELIISVDETITYKLTADGPGGRNHKNLTITAVYPDNDDDGISDYMERYGFFGYDVIEAEDYYYDTNYYNTTHPEWWPMTNVIGSYQFELQMSAEKRYCIMYDQYGNPFCKPYRTKVFYKEGLFPAGRYSFAIFGIGDVYMNPNSVPSPEQLTHEQRKEFISSLILEQPHAELAYDRTTFAPIAEDRGWYSFYQGTVKDRERKIYPVYKIHFGYFVEFDIIQEGDYILRLWLEYPPSTGEPDSVIKDYMQYLDSVEGYWIRVDQIQVYLRGLDPNNPDTDEDGLPDGIEFQNHLCPHNPDPDEDGLSDIKEFNIYQTNPMDRDTDRDGLLDGIELGLDGSDIDPDTPWDTNMPDHSKNSRYNIDLDTNTITDPTRLDTDQDGLPDGWRDGWIYEQGYGWGVYGEQELEGFWTIRQRWEGEDLDGDGSIDPGLWEENLNLNESFWHWWQYSEESQNDPNKKEGELDPASQDSDRDGMPDGWEVRYGLNPLDFQDAGHDSDTQNGAVNIPKTVMQNHINGKCIYEPVKINGRDYYYGYCWDPDIPIPDNLTNLQEFTVGTNPRSSDHDADGLSDGEEAGIVVFRTNVQEGALRFTHYGSAGQDEWVWFDGNQYGYKETLEFDVSTPFPDAIMGREGFARNIIFTLPDATVIYIKRTIGEIYVWEPGVISAGGFLGEDNDIFEGKAHVYSLSLGTALGSAPSVKHPLPEYKAREIYLTDPFNQDTDEDSIPDGLEPSWDQDTDGDGLVTARDTDSDNDTIPDRYEIDECYTWIRQVPTTSLPCSGSNILDVDNDARVNILDDDSDNDGIKDGVEPYWDQDWDRDGFPNVVDADSDNDGRPDGCVDNWGIINANIPLWGKRQGQSDGYLSPDEYEDKNMNGVYEPDLGETNPHSRDTDKDGLWDGPEIPLTYAQTGVTFNYRGELTEGTDPLDKDTDHDGITDYEEINFRVIQGEGLSGRIRNYIPQCNCFGWMIVTSDPNDPDTDKDGIIDALDYNPRSADTDGDNLPDNLEDRNLNGILDEGETSPVDQDTDNDGIPDGSIPPWGGEDLNLNGRRDLDLNETDPLLADTDSDGLMDSLEKTCVIFRTNVQNGEYWREDSWIALGFGGESLTPFWYHSSFDPNQWPIDSNFSLFEYRTPNNCSIYGTGTVGNEKGCNVIISLTPIIPRDPNHPDNSCILFSRCLIGSNKGPSMPVTTQLPTMEYKNREVVIALSDPLLFKTDSDDLNDGEEFVKLKSYFWNPDNDTILSNPLKDKDSDDDGIYDHIEPFWWLDSDYDLLPNALDNDADNDKLLDGDEDKNKNGVYEPDLGETDPLTGDTDKDGLMDDAEYRATTDPTIKDTDGDGIIDGGEYDVFSDTDGDGLKNGLDIDLDNDRLLDGENIIIDIANILDPNNLKYIENNIIYVDTNNSRIYIGEMSFGSPPWAQDMDGDGLWDCEEYSLETSPYLSDTDGDGLNDKEEVSFGTSPLKGDTDGDGLDDPYEVHYTDIVFLLQARDYSSAQDVVTTSDGVYLCHGEDPGSITFDQLHISKEGGYTIHVYLIPRGCYNCREKIGLQITRQDPSQAVFDSPFLEPDYWPRHYEIHHLGYRNGYVSVTVNLVPGDYQITIMDDSDHTCARVDYIILESQGLDPTVEDTDQDGLPDQQELNLGLSPGNCDMDGDGILDGYDLQPFSSWDDLHWSYYLRIGMAEELKKEWLVIDGGSKDKAPAPWESDSWISKHKPNDYTFESQSVEVDQDCLWSSLPPALQACIGYQGFMVPNPSDPNCQGYYYCTMEPNSDPNCDFYQCLDRAFIPFNPAFQVSDPCLQYLDPNCYDIQNTIFDYMQDRFIPRFLEATIADLPPPMVISGFSDPDGDMYTDWANKFQWEFKNKLGMDLGDYYWGFIQGNLTTHYIPIETQIPHAFFGVNLPKSRDRSLIIQFSYPLEERISEGYREFATRILYHYELYDMELMPPSASEEDRYFKKVFHNYKRANRPSGKDITEVMEVPIRYQLKPLYKDDGYASGLEKYSYQINLNIPEEIPDNHDRVYIKLNLFIQKNPLDFGGKLSGEEPIVEAILNPEQINIGAVAWYCMDKPPYQIISKSISTLRKENKNLYFLQQAILSDVDSNTPTGFTQLEYQDGNQIHQYPIYVYNHLMDQNHPSALNTIVSTGGMSDGTPVDALAIIGNSMKEISNMVDLMEFGQCWNPNGQPLFDEGIDPNILPPNPGVTKISVSYNYYLPVEELTDYSVHASIRELSSISRYAGSINHHDDWKKVSIFLEDSIQIQPFLPGIPLKDPNRVLSTILTSQFIWQPPNYTEGESISPLGVTMIRASIHTGIDTNLIPYIKYINAILQEDAAKYELLSEKLDIAISEFNEIKIENPMAFIYLSGEDTFLVWITETRYGISAVYKVIKLGKIIKENPRTLRKGSVALESIFSLYYLYKYHEYSDAAEREKAKDARDMSIAHGINAGILFLPGGAVVVGAGYLFGYSLYYGGITPRPISLGEFIVAETYLIANITGISDRTPSIIRESIEEYKDENDRVVMDWLSDYLEGNLGGYVSCINNDCFYIGDIPD